MRKHSLLFILLFGLTCCLLAQDATQGSGQPASVAGKWTLSWQGRDGARQSTLQLQQDGSKLSGTLDGDRGSVPVTGSIDGNNISFSTQSQGHHNFTMVYSGAVDGDKITGTFQPQGGEGGGMGGGGHRGGGQRNHSWTATRQAGGSSGSTSHSDDESDEPQPGL